MNAFKPGFKSGPASASQHTGGAPAPEPAPLPSSGIKTGLKAPKHPGGIQPLSPNPFAKGAELIRSHKL